MHGIQNTVVEWHKYDWASVSGTRIGELAYACDHLQLSLLVHQGPSKFICLTLGPVEMEEMKTYLQSVGLSTIQEW